MAAQVRFELTEHCCSTVFRTAAINHSTTAPYRVPGTDGAAPGCCLSSCQEKKKHKKGRVLRVPAGAADGNRTHIPSLEGWCSTIELQQHRWALDITNARARLSRLSVNGLSFQAVKKQRRERNMILGLHPGAGGRNRTPDLTITNRLLYLLSYTSIFSR